jgi:hypothetical protein
MASMKTYGMIFGIAGCIAALAGVAGYLSLKSTFERETLDHTRFEIADRASRQRQLFTDINLTHNAAERSLLRRYDDLGETDVSETFDALFPLQDDGTRRSADSLFDGQMQESGDSVYGMGAFIPNGENLAADEMRLLLAAYQAVRQHGEAAYGRFDNLYFYTPANQLIIFAPDRDDRLEFYRADAPADFDFQSEQIAMIVSQQSNPTGVVACTELSRLVYRQDGQALTTGCHKPVRQFGRHLGAIGVTIDMQNYLANAVTDHREGIQNIILTGDGSLIAHEDLLSLDELTPNAVAQTSLEVGAEDLAQRIRANGRIVGAFRHTDGRFVAFARLHAPGWYFVTLSSASGLSGRAIQLSLIIALFAFLSGLTPMLAPSITAKVKGEESTPSAKPIRNDLPNRDQDPIFSR